MHSYNFGAMIYNSYAITMLISLRITKKWFSLKVKVNDTIESYIEISHEYEDLTSAHQSDYQDSFNNAWQVLAIMLSISVMLAVFAVIMLQVMKLLQGRQNLPSLSSLEMQSEHDRLQRQRYSIANYSENHAGRPTCQVMLSSKRLDINHRRRSSLAKGGRSNSFM